jgi:hypothetical protein
MDFLPFKKTHFEKIVPDYRSKNWFLSPHKFTSLQSEKFENLNKKKIIINKCATYNTVGIINKLVMVFALAFSTSPALQTVTKPARHYPSTVCNHDNLVAIKQIVPRDTTYHQVCILTAKTHAILSSHRD